MRAPPHGDRLFLNFPTITMQLFCFGYNGCGQLRCSCTERLFMKPERFSLPEFEVGNKCCDNVSKTRAENRLDGCFNLSCRRSGGEAQQHADDHRLRSAADEHCIMELEGSVSEGILTHHADSDVTNDAEERILDNFGCTFSKTTSQINGGFVMGCLGRLTGACLSLSTLESKSSWRGVCLYGEDLFCIDDAGNCFVREINLDLANCDNSKATHSEPVLSTSKTEVQQKRHIGSKVSSLNFHTESKGWLRIQTLQDEAEEESAARTVFKYLASGDSQVVGVVEPDDGAGLLSKSESGSYRFHRFPAPTGVKLVSCGKEHTLFLTHQGLVYSYGMGSRGQLGHGDTEGEDAPRLMEALASVTMANLSAGGWHSACVSDIGDLYIWGWNESGQLGFPSTMAARSSSSQQTRDHSHCSSSSQPEDTCDRSQVTFLMVPAILDLPGGVNVSKVSCGSRHTAAVTYDKRLYTWGWGKYGQLGHGSTLSIDSPQHVDFFHENRLYVKAVRCGHWNTFVETSTAPDPMKL